MVARRTSMGETPRTCGQCRHLEPGPFYSGLVCYVCDGLPLYNLSEDRPARLCKKFAPKPAEAPHGT